MPIPHSDAITAPKVSVVIPTYNRRTYITQAVDSVLSQTLRDLQIIVIDDGSTDGTGELLDRVYGDRILHLGQRNAGASAARNAGIQRARGDYLAFIDSDDLWLPHSLERRVELLEQHRELGGVSSQLWIVDEAGERLGRRPFRHERPGGVMDFRTVLLEPCMDPTSSLYRRRWVEDAGRFDPSIRHGEDWDLSLRIAAKHPLAFIAEPLACRRVAGGRVSQVGDAPSADRRLADHVRVVEKNSHLFPGDLLKRARLRGAALAKEYAEAGVLAAVRGDHALGNAHFVRALALDRASWEDGRRISELLLQHARPIARASGGTVADRFVGERCRHLPAELAPVVTRHAKRLMGELYIELAFTEASRQRWPVVRRNLMRGLRRDPTWLANRGVLSILADALLPRRVTGPLRRLVRLAEPRDADRQPAAQDLERV
jgi:glycosyltransferase involved in cell wall biosynthesis